MCLVKHSTFKKLYYSNFYFRKNYNEKYIGHEMCVSFFSVIFMHNIFHSNKYLASYTGDAYKSSTKVLDNWFNNFSENSLILNLINIHSAAFHLWCWVQTDSYCSLKALCSDAAVPDNTNICSYLQRHHRGCIGCSRHIRWRCHCRMCFSLWCSLNARSQNIPFFDQFTICLLQLQ
jgi:hypothetical protein